ncbi:glycosyltransferase family 1 protein [Starkeya sp. ORNL1]|uniref:glycosyltransferase n=1 Tax=Starkeya sp. ORNL1 TaxID=2709380 RepID=UPI00146355C9|nr:glycosyltransferase [Starkeya sp. ORNL1]QJP17656.1 glycosyltransferase family 1 protein [Starkeya sp. ORNL1]
MRIAIHTFGTRGDVQPYIALALGLKARGHDVQVTAPAQHEALITKRGVGFFPLPGDVLALLDTPEGRSAVGKGSGFSAGFKLLKYVRPLMRGLMDEEWWSARFFGPDLIIHHPKSIAAPHIAEALSKPHILASPLPGFTPTSAFPSPIVPFTSLGPFNRISHSLMMHASGLLFGGMLRDWREQTLGVPKTAPNKASAGTLYAYSRHVVPIPPDWPGRVAVTGYWFLDEPAWSPPADLVAFLDAGEPPIYFGFGSMPPVDPDRLTGDVITALTRTGNRGVLAIGSGALRSISAPNVFVLSEAPHGSLFPRMSAVVHHGGAGTTAAALRAGKPTTICPFFGDQPFWGRRIDSLGVGPRPISQRTLTSDRLAAALAEMDGGGMQERAASLGSKIREEDGIGAAIGFIEQAVTSRRS